MEAQDLTTIIDIDDFEITNDGAPVHAPAYPHMDLHPPSKEYNLVLDLDGTLISTVDDNKRHLVRARPHLSYFLHYVFSKFKRVSIWTNASIKWYNYCYENILFANMPAGAMFDLVIAADNDGLSKKTQFDIEKYASIYGVENAASLPKNMYVKNLAHLYEEYPDYRQDNTFILDDMPFTYSMNVLNAIPIETYSVPYGVECIDEISYSYDAELIRVVYQMKTVLFGG